MKTLERREAKALYFFGGPYSNLQATRELQKILNERNISPKNIFCTGDTTAYCANPNETLSLLEEWGITSIQGNVEQQIINDEDTCGCNFKEGSECDLLSNNWYNFIRENISEKSLSYLKTFPEQLEIETKLGGIRIIHGGVENISKFFFEKTSIKSFQEELSLVRSDTSIIVAGHSGIPFAKNIGEKVWLNTGVIGMPANDGTKRAWYLELIIEEEMTANLKSFTYDSQAASKSMLESKLPREYANSLLSGLWPSQDMIPAEQRSSQGVPLLELSFSFNSNP